MNHKGILPAHHIQALFDAKHLSALKPLDDDQIQPASLDLRLGTQAYRIRASFLTGSKCNVSECLEGLKLHTIPLEQGAVLETGCVYLVPLLEELALPEHLSASTNPKSSTGRLDIFTRIITDYGQSFDKIDRGYKGSLYLEIAPRTFPILVRTGSRLSQIRFRSGHHVLSDDALKELHEKTSIISGSQPHIHNGLCVSIDLEQGNGKGLIGYRAKRHSAVVDVDKKNALNVSDFWEPLHKPDSQNFHQGLILDPDEFYILVSQEAVSIPPDYAAEMVAFDPLVGEFRVHYAGFFDPGFGDSSADGVGSRAVLEVRSREVPFILNHRQTVGRLLYEPMIERPQALYGQIKTSNYQGQALKLSKHFKS